MRPSDFVSCLIPLQIRHLLHHISEPYNFSEQIILQGLGSVHLLRTITANIVWCNMAYAFAWIVILSCKVLFSTVVIPEWSLSLVSPDHLHKYQYSVFSGPLCYFSWLFSPCYCRISQFPLLPIIIPKLHIIVIIIIKVIWIFIKDLIRWHSWYEYQKSFWALPWRYRLFVVMCCVDNHMYDLDFHDDDDDDFLGSVVFTESRLRLGTQPLGRA